MDQNENNKVIGIDKMLNKFKTELEVRTYCEVQFKAIYKLNKSIKEKDEEIAHLKELLAKSVPIISKTEDGIIVHATDEETICRTQLRRLKETSMTRELTLEETKKAEIFAKLLLQRPSEKSKEDEDAVKKMSPAELLKLVDSGDGK